MFNKVKGVKLYEEVVKQIAGMIAQGVYAPGDKLPSEKILMETMGVSRVTIREALKILAEVGIIETIRGKGSFIIIANSDQAINEKFSLSVGDLKRNFEYSSQVRIMIEPEVARLAAQKATASDIHRLENILAAERAALSEKNNQARVMDEFHKALMQIVNNPILEDILNHLLDLEDTPAKFKINKPENEKEQKAKIHEAHTKIFASIRDGNSEFAYFYMKEHIISVLSAYRHYFNYFSLDGPNRENQNS